MCRSKSIHDRRCLDGGCTHDMSRTVSSGIGSQALIMLPQRCPGLIAEADASHTEEEYEHYSFSAMLLSLEWN